MKLVYTNPTKSRLDYYLTTELKDFNRSVITKLIKNGEVLINGKLASKAGQKVGFNDILEIKLEKLSINSQDKNIKLKIIFEDENVVVVEKPIGLLSHSKGDYNPEVTVNSLLITKTTGISNERGGIVHRLDRATDGVMIYAKNETSLKYLQKLFSQRKVVKEYYAVTEGIPIETEAIIDMPIKRDTKNPKKFIVNPEGRVAKTEYEVIKTNQQKNLALIKLLPYTGRTHQLRVHLKSIGCPIVGDPLYNQKSSSKYDRMYLHAYRLTLKLPGSSNVSDFISEVPEDFYEIVK